MCEVEEGYAGGGGELLTEGGGKWMCWLEGELLMVGLCYIVRDSCCHGQHALTSSLSSSFSLLFAFPSSPSSFLPPSPRQTTSSQGLNIGTYSHQSVDRFAVLLDLWTAEAQFLESKMKVLMTCDPTYFKLPTSTLLILTLGGELLPGGLPSRV